MKRILKKAIAFLLLITIFNSLITNTTFIAFAANETEVKLTKVEYAQFQVGTYGALLTKDDKLTKNSSFLWVDLNGNRTTLKNKYGFTKIYSENGEIILHDENNDKYALLTSEGKYFKNKLYDYIKVEVIALSIPGNKNVYINTKVLFLCNDKMVYIYDENYELLHSIKFGDWSEEYYQTNNFSLENVQKKGIELDGFNAVQDYERTNETKRIGTNFFDFSIPMPKDLSSIYKNYKEHLTFWDNGKKYNLIIVKENEKECLILADANGKQIYKFKDNETLLCRSGSGVVDKSEKYISIINKYSRRGENNIIGIDNTILIKSGGYIYNLNLLSGTKSKNKYGWEAREAKSGSGLTLYSNNSKNEYNYYDCDIAFFENYSIIAPYYGKTYDYMKGKPKGDTFEYTYVGGLKVVSNEGKIIYQKTNLGFYGDYAPDYKFFGNSIIVHNDNDRYGVLTVFES